MSKDIIKGKVYVVGDDIDTDVIIPARYLTTMDPNVLKEHLFEDLENKRPYEGGMNVIVSGKNFGCGSSREHAPIAIGAVGFEAVVAKTFSRIFWRNAINGAALLPVNLGVDITDKLENGDEIIVDYKKELIILPNQEKYGFNPYTKLEKDIIEAGGLTAYNKRRLGL